MARISLSSRGSSRYSTAATTWPWWMLECRYEKPSSAGVSQPVPSGVATSARITISLQSLP